ncbi:phosphatase [Agrobacterium rubi]|nr:phosphatase [Agrobacterium rubi]NTF24318.1 phosphatase [Agrobacterium rubi]
MKIWVLSDLHFAMSHLDWDIEFPDADVCVVAGDVTDPVLESIKWLHKNIGCRMPVVYVAGNHEYYGHFYQESLAYALQESVRYPSVHFLEKGEAVIDGVRFLGATMWTDFEFFESPEQSMKIASRYMNDYRMIYYSEKPIRRFSAEISRAIHKDSREWLEKALSAPFEGPTVVVTHTCPHPLSVHEQYAGDPMNPAFVSDLAPVMEAHQPDLWVHGHTHNSFDYVAPGTKTRVVCNPRGYVKQWNMGYEVENMMFIRYKVVEV